MGSNDFAFLSSQAYLESSNVNEAKVLVSELCRHFYTLGWVSGTGGSITVKVHDPNVPKDQQLIIMSPSGVQKERMLPEDMYVLSADGSFLSTPSAKPYPHKPPKCSECAPLFMKSYQLRNAGAVIHSHGMECCLATMLRPFDKEFRITHMEMIKGIQGHGYYDELVVPIIENTAREGELTDSLTEALIKPHQKNSVNVLYDFVDAFKDFYAAFTDICRLNPLIAAYPKATAVLVRNHGIYVWGDSWISAKTQSECYHYLFDAAIRLQQMGLDWTIPSHGPLNKELGALRSTTTCTNGITNVAHKSHQHGNYQPSCILLDIEGTTTPISFVADVLFPYARDNVRKHLVDTYNSKETRDDIKLLRAQVNEDLDKGVPGSQPIPSEDAGKDKIIDSLVTNVEAMIKADRKITSLKQLQGHIWRTGYEKNELKGVFFEDVPRALAAWHNMGVKVYIYSSGSREAQRLIFGYTAYGDLRKYLCGFFDTTVGHKRETSSYTNIYRSLGVDKPSQILFVTDIIQEAEAASAAGLEVVISLRPGNAPLPENSNFRTIRSFEEI